MQTPNFEANPFGWVQQFSDPSVWQSWLQTLQKAQQADGSQQTASADAIAGMLDPAALSQLQNDYTQQFSSLWQDFLAAKSASVKDKRFSSAAWQGNPLYSFNAALYLLNARFMLSMADAVQASPKVKQKIRFAVQQAADAMSPANFLATNPEAQQKIIETKGEGLARGGGGGRAGGRGGRGARAGGAAGGGGRGGAAGGGAGGGGDGGGRRI